MFDGKLIHEGMYYDVVQYGAFPNETFTIQQKNGVRLGSSSSEERAIDKAILLDKQKTSDIYCESEKSAGGSETK